MCILKNGVNVIIVQFDLSPWLWPYGGIIFTLSGGFASAVAVSLAVVTAKAPLGTKSRWVAVLSIEFMFQFASCFEYIVGLIITKYRITGILSVLWSCIGLIVFTFFLVTFKFREDTVKQTTARQTLITLFSGLRKIYFQFEPGVFVGPIIVTFFLHVFAYGSIMVLVLYLTAPPMSLSAAEYGAYKTFRSLTSMMCYFIMTGSRRWKISEWTYIAFSIVSFAVVQLVYGFGTTKST